PRATSSTSDLLTSGYFRGAKTRSLVDSVAETLLDGNSLDDSGVGTHRGRKSVARKGGQNKAEKGRPDKGVGGPGFNLRLPRPAPATAGEGAKRSKKER